MTEANKSFTDIVAKNPGFHRQVVTGLAEGNEVFVAVFIDEIQSFATYPTTIAKLRDLNEHYAFGALEAAFNHSEVRSLVISFYANTPDDHVVVVGILDGMADISAYPKNMFKLPPVDDQRFAKAVAKRQRKRRKNKSLGGTIE